MVEFGRSRCYLRPMTHPLGTQAAWTRALHSAVRRFGLEPEVHPQQGATASVMLRVGPPMPRAEAERVADSLSRELGWVSRAGAAQALGVSVKRVDQLRHRGALEGTNVRGRMRILVKSLQGELERRRNNPDRRLGRNREG